MDHKDEQDMELEALRSIYPDEFTLMSEEQPYQLQILIRTSQTEALLAEGEELPADTLEGVLEVTMPLTYPEELPELQFRLTKGEEVAPASLLDQVAKRMQGSAEELLGMAMVFSVASEAKEELSDVQTAMRKDAEEAERRAEEEAERRAKEAEEERERQLIGTRVTKDSFVAWWTKFMAENHPIVQRDKKKLTGRQLFERDTSLALSDNKYSADSADVTERPDATRTMLVDRDEDDDDAVVPGKSPAPAATTSVNADLYGDLDEDLDDL